MRSAAPTVARKLGEILRGETYLDRAFVATIADGVGEPGEEIEPYDLVRGAGWSGHGARRGRPRPVRDRRGGV